MMRLRRAAAAPVVLALGLALATAAPLLLSGCSVNPATGEEQFTAFLSPDEERRVGAQEHPKLVEAFGGLYDDPALQRYVSSLGRLLQQTSEQPEPPFTIVILDSPAVNAFALPGGYVHVTRGLMALANDEAELAGVIAHEIGHVTARHSAERYSHGLVAGLGAAILGTVIDNQTVSDIANLAAGAYVQGYSRSQELEADTLGVRYLSRSGFDATAMSSFLEAMEGEAALARKIAGKRGQGAQGGLFASHPRTADRVRATAGAAQAKFGGERARALYLRRIDGMIYGDSPEEGFVRGRAFAHPVLRIAFTAPPGFILRNAPEAVVGAHPSGATMRFDEATLANPSISTWRYLRGVWASKVPLTKVERTHVDGLDAVAASTRVRTKSGVRDVRLVAIRAAPQRVYRFFFVTPQQQTRREFSVPFRQYYSCIYDVVVIIIRVSRENRMIASFRRLSVGQAANLRPLRLRVVEVAPTDTVESLAARMPFNDRRLSARTPIPAAVAFATKPALAREMIAAIAGVPCAFVLADALYGSDSSLRRMPRFQVLNGLRPGQRLRPGQLMKIVTEVTEGLAGANAPGNHLFSRRPALDRGMPADFGAKPHAA